MCVSLEGARPWGLGRQAPSIRVQSLWLCPLAAQAHAKAKNNTRKTATFCKLYATVLKLLYDPIDIQAVLGANDDWSSVSSHIFALGSTHYIGKKIFATGIEEVRNSEMSKQLKEAVVKIMQGAETFTLKMWEDSRRSTVDALLKNKIYDDLPDYRKLRLKYRGSRTSTRPHIAIQTVMSPVVPFGMGYAFTLRTAVLIVVNP